MRSGTRLLVVTLLGLLVALLPASPVYAAAVPSDREYGLVAQQPTGPSTEPSAPTVDLTPAESEDDRKETRRKLTMGITSVVLIGLVIWGRSVRRKKKKKAEG
jgi:hypothetical protein